MKVFFLPWNHRNPYQENLAEALREHGVEVTGHRPGKFLPVLRLLVRQGQPEVLHLHWISGYVVSRFRLWALLSSALLLAELLTVRALGVRLVWTIHNLVEHKKRAPGFERRVFRLVARICHVLIVHSEHGRRTVAEAYRIKPGGARIAVIPHGNYLPNYPDQVTDVAARARLGIAPDSFVYLFFGMVRPYKGVEELLDAFAALDDPTATLLIAGSCVDSALRARILAAAEHDRRIVMALRYVDAEEVQYYMRAADAVVLPFSDVFTSGSAVLAMGFGRALVVPRIGCLPDYVDSHGGILYDPAAGYLRQALRDIARADCRAMGRHNRTVALQRLGWEQIAAETAALYNPAVPVASRSSHRSPNSVATS